MLQTVTFFVFGALVVAIGVPSPAVAVAALILFTLFVARPVAIMGALAGSELPRIQRRFLAWFGPKGVASMLFALFVLKSEDVAEADLIFQLAALVILFSIIAHGLTDTLGARWMERRLGTEGGGDAPGADVEAGGDAPRQTTERPTGHDGLMLESPSPYSSQLVDGDDQPALKITDLTKKYPTGTEALKGVSLEIASGEFFGLLGPNGAGKSTLIHCSTGLASPSSGSIRIFGNDAVDGYQAAREAVGLAPQDLNLDWFLTVEETLDFHGGYFGMKKNDRRERVKELLDAFTLTEKKDERTRTLSGGMKRRLVLARALMHRPRLLILDEPTAGVDVELRLELWQYVQRVNAEEGTTILLTTHYLEEAEQLCSRIAFINGGQIVAEGTSRDLAAEYQVESLEDAYLELVGRKELSRAKAIALAEAEGRALG